MRRFVRTVRSELVTTAKPALLVTAVIAVTLLSVGVAVTPVAIWGDDESLGWHAIGPALSAGAALAAVVGVYSTLSQGWDGYEQGMRRVRYLAGTCPTMLTLAQLAVSLILAAGTVASVAVLTVLASLADAGRRRLVSADFTLTARARPVSDGIGLLVLDVAATTIVALLVLGLRSGRQAAVALGGAASSWLLLLMLVPAGSMRSLLALHPLAWPWRVLCPIDSAQVGVDAPPLLYAAGALATGCGLLIGAVRNLHRP